MSAGLASGALALLKQHLQRQLSWHSQSLEARQPQFLGLPAGQRTPKLDLGEIARAINIEAHLIECNAVRSRRSGAKQFAATLTADQRDALNSAIDTLLENEDFHQTFTQIEEVFPA